MSKQPDNHASLLAFARDILTCWPDGGIDGPELQDTAVKHGLLVPETRYAPCGEEGTCSCAEYAMPEEFAAGVTCYRRAEWVRVEKVDGQAGAPAPIAREADDLAALVARLAHALRKAAPYNELPEKALGYLQRKGAMGSPMRETADQNLRDTP